MFDNSTSNNTGFSPSSGDAIWQNEWIEEIWQQLTTGTFNGIGHVVVEGDSEDAQNRLLSDLDTLDSLISDRSRAGRELSKVQRAARNGFNPATDPLTGNLPRTARSLANILSYAHNRGLPDLAVEVGSNTLSDVATGGERGQLTVTLRNQGGLKAKTSVTVKVYAAREGELGQGESGGAIEIGEQTIERLRLKAHRSRQIEVDIELPEQLPSGSYDFFVVVDTQGQLPEANTANNIARAEQSQIVASAGIAAHYNTPQPFAVMAEGYVSVNGRGDFDGNPNVSEDDALIYGGRGLNVNGRPILPVQRDDNGNIIRDERGRPLLLENALAVSDDYQVINYPNHRYSDLTPPQVIDGLTVEVPDHQGLVNQTLTEEVPAGTQPIELNVRDARLNNRWQWHYNFPRSGSAEQPTVVRVTNGHLNIPNRVSLENTVLIVEDGNVNFNGYTHRLNNVTIIAENGSVNLAGVSGRDVNVLASGNIHSNRYARLTGDSLLSSGQSVVFNGATNNSQSDRLKVVAQDNIYFNSRFNTRAQFIAGGDFSYNGHAKLYGRIQAKGNIHFNGYAQVFATNDAPVVGQNRAIVVAEDSGATALGITPPIDPDGDSLKIVVNEVPDLAKGTIRLADGSIVTPGQALTISDLQSLNFVTAQDANGAAGRFSYIVGDGWQKPVSQTITVQVSAVNDAPVITAPSALTVAEDEVLSFPSGLQIQDVDADNSPVQATLSVSHGSLKLGEDASETVGQQQLMLSGTLTEVNAQLAQVSYRAEANYAGIDALEIVVSDLGDSDGGGALTDTATVELTVTPVNDAPTISGPALVSLPEDTQQVIAGLQVADIDAADSEISVSLSVENGALSVTQTADIEVLTGDASGSVELVLQGAVSAINAALSTVAYQGLKDFAGDDRLLVTVNDLGNTGAGGALTQVQTIDLVVTPVNDAPTVVGPETVAVIEDSPKIITGLTVSDVDGEDTELLVRLNVGAGTLELQTTEALTLVEGSFSESAEIVFQGTVTAVNAALESLTYQGAPDYAGTDTLLLSVNDLGNTGAGGALSQSRSVDINVTPVDTEAPSVTLGLQEDTGLDSTDNITSSPTVQGTVNDESDVLSLKAGFNDTPVSEYVDISSYVRSGTFTLDEQALEAILARSLTDGTYSLTVIAEDSVGNVSAPVVLSFTVDTARPTLSVTELQTVDTADGRIRLVGSTSEATTVTATIDGSTPTTFELAAGEFEQSLQSVPSEAGEYELILSLTDLAGNTTQTTRSFEVTPAGPINQAPIFETIEPLTVMPGQRIEVPLQATDPEGNLVTYAFRSEGTLPQGTLDGSGTLVFEPTPDEVGSYEFTLVATDGETTTEQIVSLTVAPDPDTTTRISGQILDIEGNALANLPLTLGRLQTLTDTDGYFTFVVPETSFPTEEIDIEIPFGDPAFDPFFTGTSEIDLRRTTFDGATGTSISNPLRHPNLVSTFMDASMVYGSNAARAAALRTNDGTGQLKVSDGNLLPINNSEFFPDGTLANSNRGLTDPATLFATGDVRANENIALTAMHTVFVREHNRLAEEMSAANPELSGEEIYQRARKLVAAQIQHITYSEYLPLLIGDNTIADYAGYDNSIDPSVSHLFSAAAFRMGHTQSFSEFLLIDENGDALPSVSLNQSTFNPGLVQQYGLDPILRGLFAQQSEAIDTKVITELRNTLFGPPGSGGIDLAAVDIQRGRDVGLPDYNQARVDFGLAPVTSFAEITSDVDVQAKLEQVYGDVSDIDAIVGGLAEDAQPGAMVGEFFQKVIADQFTRLRDGDRFWYENGQFTEEELSLIRGTSLSALLVRNTEITGLSENLFSTGRDPAALEQGGSVAAQTVTEYATLDGSNNNLENPELGTPGTNLRVDYTQEYGDGIRTLAGQERANVREISNTVFAQTESIPDPTGATGYMLAWSQFMGHDMTFAPAGAADTLKIYGTEFESPTGEEFPFVAEKLPLVLGHEVYAGVNNVIERPIYLPALAIDDNVQTVDADGDITVTNANLAAQVFVDADSLVDNRGNPFEGQLTITEVPRDLTPAVLPDTLLPDLVVTIQPGEMVFETPARLTLPNRSDWMPGQTMDLWSINPTTGDFEVVGVSRVSADGERIETIEGGIRNSSWHFVGPRPPELQAQSEPPHKCKEGVEFTSTVDLDTGALIEEHSLVTYQSFGETRGIQLVYDSLRADARPVINTEVFRGGFSGDIYAISSITVDTGNVKYQIPGASPNSFGANEGGEHIWKFPPGNGGTLRTPLQADLRSQDSGVYNYDLKFGFYRPTAAELDVNFSGTSRKEQRTLVHINTIDSRFGSGWGISGLQEIVENPNGSVLLIDGDGTESVFETNRDGSQYDSPTGDFSVLEKLDDGTFRRTTTENTVYQFNENHDLASVIDRNGNATQYEYNGEELIKIIDPAGLETLFSYDAEGRVSAITDPAGRVTQLSYDRAGNLIRIEDPDLTQRTFEYDELNHMVAEIDKNGHREEAFYDFSGRARSAIQKDGTVVQVNPTQTQGLYRPEETTDFANAPLAYANTGNVESFIDGNGNVITTNVNANGLSTGRSSDETLSQRANGLIVRSVDREGHTTAYDYDDNGNLTKVIDSIAPESASRLDNYESDSEFEKIIVGDFDGDGFDDIATAESELVRLFYSNGDKTFRTPVEYSQSGITTPDMRVEDIDKDGDLDLLVYGDSSLTTLSNDGAGIFTSITTEGDFSRFNIVDVDGDENFDILNEDGEWFRGRGDGSFDTDGNNLFSEIDDSFDASLLDDIAYERVTVADFDGDGDLDIVTPGYGYSASTVFPKIFLNTGDGTWWTDEEEIIADDRPRDVIVSYDLDGDADFDLVFVDTQYNLQGYINNGNGVFSEAENVDELIFDDRTSDWNGRRPFDVLSSRTGETIIDGNNFSFESPFAIELNAYRDIKDKALKVQSAKDLDGDGDLDIIASGGGYGDEKLYFIDNQGSGNWQVNNVESLNQANNFSRDTLKTVDLNQDGLQDIVYESGGDVSFRLGTGTNRLSSEIDLDFDGSIKDFDVADVNQDGYVDVVAAGSNKIFIATGDGTGRFENDGGTVTGEIFSQYWQSILVGQFDSNASVDIVGISEDDVVDSFENASILKVGFDFLPGVGQKDYRYDDTFSQLTFISDEAGQRTLYELDEFGNRTTRVRVVGEIDSLFNGEIDDIVTRYSYRQGGLIDEITDPDGIVTKHQYDQYGRLTQIDYDLGDVDSPVTSYIYNSDNLTGLHDSVISSDGVRTDYVYDLLNRISQRTITDGNSISTTVYEYDNMGNVTLETDASGEVRTVYDPKGRISQVTNVDGSTLAYEYDGNGNRTRIYEDGELVESNTYDERDLLIATADKTGRTTQYEYDSNGALSQKNDGRLRVSYVRDSRGRVVEEIFEESDADGLSNDSRSTADSASSDGSSSSSGDRRSVKYKYDATDKVIEKIDSQGQLIKFAYDSATYQPTKVEYTGDGSAFDLAYKVFEQDESTFHKPEVIKGEFGELLLNYTEEGQFKGSSNDALLEVFVAAVGAKTVNALVEMLSYRGEEVEEHDPLCIHPDEQAEEDKLTPTQEMMDAWARIGAIALLPNENLREFSTIEYQALSLQKDILNAVSSTAQFASYRTDVDLLSEAVGLASVYAVISPDNNSTLESSESIDFFLNTLWNVTGQIEKASRELELYLENSKNPSELLRTSRKVIEVIQILSDSYSDIYDPQEFQKALKNDAYIASLLDVNKQHLESTDDSLSFFSEISRLQQEDAETIAMNPLFRNQDVAEDLDESALFFANGITRALRGRAGTGEAYVEDLTGPIVGVDAYWIPSTNTFWPDRGQYAVQELDRLAFFESLLNPERTPKVNTVYIDALAPAGATVHSTLTHSTQPIGERGTTLSDNIFSNYLESRTGLVSLYSSGEPAAFIDDVIDELAFAASDDPRPNQFGNGQTFDVVRNLDNVFVSAWMEGAAYALPTSTQYEIAEQEGATFNENGQVVIDGNGVAYLDLNVDSYFNKLEDFIVDVAQRPEVDEVMLDDHFGVHRDVRELAKVKHGLSSDQEVQDIVTKRLRELRTELDKLGKPLSISVNPFNLSDGGSAARTNSQDIISWLDQGLINGTLNVQIYRSPLSNGFEQTYNDLLADVGRYLTIKKESLSDLDFEVFLESFPKISVSIAQGAQGSILTEEQVQNQANYVLDNPFVKYFESEAALENPDIKTQFIYGPVTVAGFDYHRFQNLNNGTVKVIDGSNVDVSNSEERPWGVVSN